MKKTPAVVLRRLGFQNSSLIVSFLSPEEGLLEAVAKGARRANSPLSGTLDYFNSGELVYYPKKTGSLELVSQFSPDRERPHLKRDARAAAAAAFMCELAAIGSAGNHPAHAAFELLENGLDFLDAVASGGGSIGGTSGGAAAVVFGIKFFELQGYAIPWEACAACGKPLEKGTALFSAQAGGPVCAECEKKSAAASVSAGALSAMRFLSGGDYRACARLALRTHDLRAAVSCLLALSASHFNRKLKSAAVLLRLLEA